MGKDTIVDQFCETIKKKMETGEFNSIQDLLYVANHSHNTIGLSNATNEQLITLIEKASVDFLDEDGTRG